MWIESCCLSIIIFQTLLSTTKFFQWSFIYISIVYLLFFCSNQHLLLELTWMVLHKQLVLKILSRQTFKGAERLLSKISTDCLFTYCKTYSMRKILNFFLFWIYVLINDNVSHWFLFIVNMKEEYGEIWDLLPDGQSNKKRKQQAECIVCYMCICCSSISYRYLLI